MTNGSFEYDKVKQCSARLYPDHLPSPALYDRFGKELSFGKGDGKPAASHPKPPYKPFQRKAQPVKLTAVAEDGTEGEHDPDAVTVEDDPDAAGEDDAEAEVEEEGSEEPDDDVGEELEGLIDTMHDVLSISAQKLKNITKGRKFTTKPTFKKPGTGDTKDLAAKKAASNCADCGEKGHWKGDPQCKTPGARKGFTKPSGSGGAAAPFKPRPRQVRTVTVEQDHVSSSTCAPMAPFPVRQTVRLLNEQSDEIDPKALKNRQRDSLYVYMVKRVSSIPNEVWTTTRIDLMKGSGNHAFGVLDTGCERGIVGEDYLDHIAQVIKTFGFKIAFREECERFTFGDSKTTESTTRAIFACAISEIMFLSRSSVVRLPLPLLLSKIWMRLSGAVIDMVSFTVSFVTLGIYDIPMQVADNGHLLVDITQFPAKLELDKFDLDTWPCLLYTSPSPRDQRGSRMPSSA